MRQHHHLSVAYKALRRQAPRHAADTYSSLSSFRAGNVLSLLPLFQTPWQGPQAYEVQIEMLEGEEFWEMFAFSLRRKRALGFALSLLPALDTGATFGAVAVILGSLGK